MSRRFSDEPINLIQRIPSPEQISAARPSKRSYGRVIIESGAALIRGVAEAIAQVRRAGRIPGTAVSEGAGSRDSSFVRVRERVSGGLRVLAGDCSRSYGRLAAWIANPDASVHPSSQAPPDRSEGPAESFPAIEPMGPSIQPGELAELRTFILVQQEDMARLSAQLQELKSLVVSQQQVLLQLGKELELTQSEVPAMTAAASAPAKRNRVIRERLVAKDEPIPRKGTQGPSLDL